MANLKTKYMGLELKNPLVVGSSNLTANMDMIRKLEDAGAGALVIKSLFEEQIQLQKFVHDEDLGLYDEWHAEMTSIFPKAEHAGPEEHLMWIRRTVESVSVPVIASLNAVNHDTWVEWSKKLEETGAHGLELNFFATPSTNAKDSATIEAEQVEALKAVKQAVKIPVSVKLSAFYTNPVAFITKLDEIGVDGFVLFNRFFHPALDPEREVLDFPFNLSSSSDHRLALRFIGLLSGKVKGGLIASNGIHSAQDAASVLLAGAEAFQAVSVLYKDKIDALGTILKDLENWMDQHGYKTIDDFRGKLSIDTTKDKVAYRRAQYVSMLLRAEEYIKRPAII